MNYNKKRLFCFEFDELLDSDTKLFVLSGGKIIGHPYEYEIIIISIIDGDDANVEFFLDHEAIENGKPNLVLKLGECYCLFYVMNK